MAAFPALLALVVLVGVLLRRQLVEIFASPEALRRWILHSGVVAPLVFVAVQAFQVVIFFIPGEIPQVAGGYLFGLLRGSLLSLAGILLGSSLSFGMARLLGVPFVNALFDRDKVERVRSIVESSRGRITFFLFFLIPGIPKDILCYAGGLTTLSLPAFLLLSTLGRIPGIVGSALMGNAAADRRWILAGSVFFVAAALFLIGFLLRGRIQQLLERISGPAARRRAAKRSRRAGGEAGAGGRRAGEDPPDEGRPAPPG